MAPASGASSVALHTVLLVFGLVVLTSTGGVLAQYSGYQEKVSARQDAASRVSAAVTTSRSCTTT